MKAKRQDIRQPVIFNGFCEVIATPKAFYMKSGETYKVSEKQAEYFVKNGLAEYK